MSTITYDPNGNVFRDNYGNRLMVDPELVELAGSIYKALAARMSLPIRVECELGEDIEDIPVLVVWVEFQEHGFCGRFDTIEAKLFDDEYYDYFAVRIARDLGRRAFLKKSVEK